MDSLILRGWLKDRSIMLLAVFARLCLFPCLLLVTIRLLSHGILALELAGDDAVLLALMFAGGTTERIRLKLVGRSEAAGMLVRIRFLHRRLSLGNTLFQLARGDTGNTYSTQHVETAWRFVLRLPRASFRLGMETRIAQHVVLCPPRTAVQLLRHHHGVDV